MREIILRLAAYRATHGGQEPPSNSRLSEEKERLMSFFPRRRGVLRFLRRHRPFPDGPEWNRIHPLRPFLVERDFLTDDTSEREVSDRLEAWPMVTAYRSEGRVYTGEWFTYTVQIMAETPRQARLFLDCICAVEPPPRQQEETREEGPEGPEEFT